MGLVGVPLLRPPAGPTFPGALDRPDGVHQILEDLGVVHVGGGEHRGEGKAVAVGQEVVLGAGLAAVGGVWPDRFAPLFAGTLAEPKLALDQSTIPALPSRSSSARCRRCQTPALSASTGAVARRSRRFRSHLLGQHRARVRPATEPDLRPGGIDHREGHT